MGEHWHTPDEEGNQEPLKVRKRGRELLSDSLLNKGTGFPDSERDALGLRGLVPPQVVSIDDQVSRVMENFQRQETDLGRYIHLEGLHDRNETLYYRVLLDHIRELTPIVYTPTVGKACQEFGHIYRRARGMYFNAWERDYFDEMVANWPESEVDIVVVTDGSRILGLGDLGSNGMGIPIGKLSLYVAGAGIHPERTLPIMLDVGTNNTVLRDDPLYLGERTHRCDDATFYATVDALVQAVLGRWPNALIQFEDFSNNHAFPLLERYREQILCFNDDIQGTGAVTLAAILGALRVTGETLAKQRVLFLGAGSAARGIADSIVAGMVVDAGLNQQQAREQIWMMDSKGLVTKDRLAELADHKRDYAHPGPPITDLVAAIEQIQPQVLIGVSGRAGAFDEAVVQAMSRYASQPILLPLSNPTVKAECSAEQAYAWSDGNALFASGSPFPPVNHGGRIFVPGQCNNMYIFPGVGLGAIACQARHITDEMFHAAAETLAGMVSDESLASGCLLPDLKLIREISAEIAVAVCEVAYARHLADLPRPDDLEQHVRRRMYQPCYRAYQAV